MTDTAKKMPLLETRGLKKTFGTLEVLKGVDDIGIVRLTHRDVVRHELVQAIVRAYEKYAQRTDRRGGPARG